MINVENAKKPVIFSFHVTEIKHMKSPDELKEWETLMQRKVGIKLPHTLVSGSATTSCCPDCDDCDMD